MIGRRIFAFTAFFGAAIVSALYWADDGFEWLKLGTNLVAATIGFVWLHYHWKAKEARIMTPKKAEDIFS